MNDQNAAPTREDLLSISAYSSIFERDDFVAGEWVKPENQQIGLDLGQWWISTGAVEHWHQALYDHRVIDPNSDYLSEETVSMVHQLMTSPDLVTELDLPTLRRVLTFLVRAERHTGGGWFEDAFKMGLAQAATKRLGELSK